MRLFFKLALSLSLVFAFLAGITALVLQATLLDGFEEVEDQVARENVKSVAKTIANQERALMALALDYGHWAETYEFALGSNASYPDEQIGHSTLLALGIDAAYFFDTDGNMVWGESPDEMFDQDIGASTLLAMIQPTELTAAEEIEWMASGTLSTSRGLILVGATSILNNDSSGPAAGVVVFLKLNDQEFLEDILEQMRFKASYHPLSTMDHCNGMKLVAPKATSDSVVTICKDSNSRLSGMTLVHDPLGTPVSVLSVVMPRDIAETGRAGFKYALALLGIASLVAILTVGLALQRIVTRPLGILSRTIQTVNRTGEILTRSNLTSSDEIGMLSRKFDSMLDSLDVAGQELNAAKHTAEQANRAKSEFLTMMSHEIRTPLNGVIGMAEVLRMSDMTDKQHSMAEIIESSGRSLLEILNNILDLSKLEAGHTELHEQSADVNDVVEASVRMMLPSIRDNKIVLETEIDPDVPTSFTCDVGKLQQILRNYIGNGIKFTAQGTVLIHVSLKSASDGSNPEVCFAVEDTGIGILPEAKEKLFNRFVQADNSTSRRFGGTGLGLAICKELATLMGGKVGCESVEGKGSTFWVALPARDMEHDDQYLAASEARDPGTLPHANLLSGDG
jgi:signal transduction histidine kinase